MEKKFRTLRDKKINILTLVLSQKNILNEKKTLHVKWSVPEDAWKIIAMKHQNKFWKETYKEDKKNKMTLKYLQLQETITKPHNIWHGVKNSEFDVKAGEIKAKLATQTYMVVSKIQVC